MDPWLRHQIRLADYRGIYQRPHLSPVQEFAVAILVREREVAKRKEEMERIKIAALGAPALQYAAFDPSKIFPEVFQKPKSSTASSEDDIDYSQVEWEAPEEDEWERTMQLLNQHQRLVTTVDDDSPSPTVPDFDSIPLITGENVEADRDDLEWGA